MAIKKYREARGLTQAKLASELGVNQSTVAYWESGQTFPRGSTLKKLCKLLGCSADEILDIGNEEEK